MYPATETTSTRREALEASACECRSPQTITGDLAGGPSKAGFLPARSGGFVFGEDRWADEKFAPAPVRASWQSQRSSSCPEHPRPNDHLHGGRVPPGRLKATGGGCAPPDLTPRVNPRTSPPPRTAPGGVASSLGGPRVGGKGF